MVVGFVTTCAISAYHHLSCEFEPHSWRGVIGTTLCDKVCQWLVSGLWFSPGTPLSSTNKTDCHDITEILLKVVLNIVKPTLYIGVKSPNKSNFDSFVFLGFLCTRGIIQSSK